MNKHIMILFVLASAFVFGCGSGLTKVSGKVTLDGSPVEGAVLMFSQTGNPSVMATGTTDANGNYSLITFRGGDKALKGAAAGSYIVSIVKKDEDGPPKKDTSQMTIEEKINYEMSLSSKEMKAPKFIYHVPQKYEIAEKSGLTAEIPNGGSTVCDFALEK
jgi:hypothetical protein